MYEVGNYLVFSLFSYIIRTWVLVFVYILNGVFLYKQID